MVSFKRILHWIVHLTAAAKLAVKLTFMVDVVIRTHQAFSVDRGHDLFGLLANGLLLRHVVREVRVHMLLLVEMVVGSIVLLHVLMTYWWSNALSSLKTQFFGSLFQDWAIDAVTSSCSSTYII